MQAAPKGLRQNWRFANAIHSIPPETMTGKVLDSGASGALILLLPLALTMVVLFTAWPAILLLIILGMSWSLWQHYQWKQWCQQVDPSFHQLIQEHRGYLTPMDLSLKTKLTGRAARRYLDKKAEEYGAQCKEEDKGRVYYFLTAGALGSIFDDSEPSELDEVSESHLASASSAVEVPPSTAAQLGESESESVGASVEPPEPEASTESSPATESVASDTSTATVLQDSSTVEAHQESSPQFEAQQLSEASEEEDDHDLERDNTANGKPPPEENPLSNFLEATSEEHQPSTESDFSLIQAELAKRLDLHSSTVGKRKSEPDFSEWSQSRDPDGIAWQYVPETKMFVPLESETF